MPGDSSVPSGRTRTLNFSATGQTKADPTYYSYSVPAGTINPTVFNQSASLGSGAPSYGFQQDTTFVSPAPWGQAGSQQRWRAYVTFTSSRQANSDAGYLAATTDTQTFYDAWIIYDYPYNPSHISHTHDATNTAAFSGTLTLEERWGLKDYTGMGVGSNITTDPWERLTGASISVNFSSSQSFTLNYYGNNNVTQTFSPNYSYTGTYTQSSTTLDKPWRNYSVSFEAVVMAQSGATPAPPSTVSWTITASGPGLQWSGAVNTVQTSRSGFWNSSTGVSGVGSTGTGTGSFSGSVFSGTLTQNTVGEWSHLTATHNADIALDGVVDGITRYQDGAGLSGVPVQWTTGPDVNGVVDPGSTLNTDVNGAASGFHYPYAGGVLTGRNVTLNNVTTLSEGTPALTGMQMRLDPNWADQNGVMLVSSVGYQTGLLQYRTQPDYTVGTWKLDNSHAFGLFASTVSWSLLSGTGTASYDAGLAALKLATTTTCRFTHTVTAKTFRPCFYRYLTLHMRADTAGAQVRIGLAHWTPPVGTIQYQYWTITVNQANTWEDHEIDLLLPTSADDTSTPPMDYLWQPIGFYTDQYGQMVVDVQTAGATVWLQSVTGNVKQTGNRIPVLLLHDLNAGVPEGSYSTQHNATTTDYGYTREYNVISPAPPSSRWGNFNGNVWGRLIVNGALCADFTTSSSGWRSIPTDCNGFWQALRQYYDDTANDTGLHLTYTAPSPLYNGSASHDWKRSGALWTRPNDTTATTVSVAVSSSQSQQSGMPTGYPGCGDYHQGTTYAARLTVHFHGCFGGEILGCLGSNGRAPLSGAALSLYRVTGGNWNGGMTRSLLTSTLTTNDDGFFRYFAPYGAIQPVTNNPTVLNSPPYVQQYDNVSGAVVYRSTTLAQAFNPFLIAGKPFKQQDTDGNAQRYRPNAGPLAPELLYCFDRFGTYFGWGDCAGPLRGVCILSPMRGGVHLAYGSTGGDIKYKTSPTPGVPTFGAEISVTGGTTDSEPRMAEGDPQGRIKLVFTRGADVYLTNSDGDGEAGTWSTPVALFNNAKHPTVCYDPTSRTWFFAAYSAGALTGSIQGPADSAPIAPFTLTDNNGANLAPDDDTFHVAPAAADSARRWELAFLKGGSVVVYQCTDDGSSWKQIV